MNKLIKLIFCVSLIIVLANGCVLKSKYENLSVAKQDIDKKYEELRLKNEELKKQLEEALSQNERISARNEEISSLNQQLAQRNKDLASGITDYRSRSMTLETELIKKEAKLSEIQKTYNDLTRDLKKEIDAGNVKIEELKGMLKVNVVSEVLFRSGSDEIISDGKGILDKVAKTLASIKDKRIEIQGHTDDRRITGKLTQIFPTNWELSTARASKIVRYLEDYGLDPSKLSAAGYGSNHPVASNDTEEGRQKNRRIEIVLLPLIDQ